jgi:hypothetical protein
MSSYLYHARGGGASSLITATNTTTTTSNDSAEGILGSRGFPLRNEQKAFSQQQGRIRCTIPFSFIE